jgi:hypothetical protein
MTNKAFERKVDRDVDKAKESLVTLHDDGVTALSRVYEQLAGDAKETVAARKEEL